jgi:mannose/cellobiose epimerase-like protein (N-acyl-D-glucosamine 2-epimerase family)
MIAGRPRAFLSELLDFWAARAWNKTLGGFVRELDMSGEPRPEPMRLCLVQTRCLYAYSHAAIVTGDPAMLDMARRTYAFFTARFGHPSGLWVTAADPREGGPRDERLDFYDQAFVLFALAWWARASGDETALDLAQRTMAGLDRELGDSVSGGWREDDGGTLPRRQNPHMHLLEAMHALQETTGEARWLDRAREIVDLFRGRFLDEPTATVREYLGPDLAPLNGEPGDRREPGHSFEWVWLLLHHARIAADPSARDLARALHRRALLTGVDAAGHALEATHADGRVLDGSHLLWPQTEAVKAALAGHEFLDGPLGAARAGLAALERAHFPQGGFLWINRATSGGTPLTDGVPTRLLYHLVLMLAEFIRIEDSASRHDLMVTTEAVP